MRITNNNKIGEKKSNNSIQLLTRLLCVIVVMFLFVYIIHLVQGREDEKLQIKSIKPLENIDHLVFSNPLDIKYIGDPYILKANDMYYCYATSAHNGFKVWESSDLVNWTDLGLAYRRSADAWSGSNYWAPEVTEKDGRYYMFYSARSLKESRLIIGLAISDNPAGPFTDVTNKPFYDPGYAVIDASVFIDDDNQAYLYYAIDCSEHLVGPRYESHIAAVRLSPDLMSIVSEEYLLTKPDQKWEEIEGGDHAWNEGPIVHKHDERYYLFYSANFFASRSYSVGYAVSDSPLGPFYKASEPLLWHSKSYGESFFPAISGPGHNSLAWSPDNRELFIVYHTHMDPTAPSGDRQTAIDRLFFTADGRIITNGPSLAHQPLPSGAGGLKRVQPKKLQLSEPVSDIISGLKSDKESVKSLSFDFDDSNLSLIAIIPHLEHAPINIDILLNGIWQIEGQALTYNPSEPGKMLMIGIPHSVEMGIIHSITISSEDKDSISQIQNVLFFTDKD